MEGIVDPIKRPLASVTDLAFEAIYRAVISLELPPGTKISEADIASQLGVSRQPVRDAFFRLSNLGFLSIRPQRATLITKISLRAVYDAVFTRTALEVECLRIAMSQAKTSLVTSLEESLAQQRAFAGGDMGDFHVLDEAFHEIICNAAGHAHVWSLIKEQKAHLDRIRYLTLSEERRHMVVADHAEILTAVTSGNNALAEDRLRAHIGDVQIAARHIRDSYPDYFETA